MTTTTYGGWITERPVATGGSFSFVRLVGWVAMAGATTLTCLGTGGELSLERLQRAVAKAQYAAPATEIAGIENVRKPSEDLFRIREVFSPSVSDLATAFGVTRQSVYNWLNGGPVAEENAVKLRDLAYAADLLVDEGVTINSVLLKRKFANGKTLLQVVQVGESARDAALLFVQIHKREIAQRERLNARFANRVRSPTTADFDLPAPNDRA